MKKTILGLLLLCLVLFQGCGGSGSDRKFHDQDDLSEARIGVLMGSTHDNYITKKFPNATILRIDTEPDLVLSLDSKKTDAIVLDAAGYSIRHAQNDYYQILDTLFIEYCGIGFNQGNLELRDQFNRFLAEVRADGTYDTLMSHWFKNNTNARMPGWKDKPAGNPIKIGITGHNDGFAFIRDGKPAGFDVDLLERFGRSIGRPVEFSYINLSGLIAALVSEKVDIISSGITITPERSLQVAFSDPYFVSQSLAVVLKNRYDYGNSSSGASPELSSGWRSMDDLKNKRIGVLMASIQDEYVTRTYPQAEMLRIDHSSDLVMSLKSNQCDGIVIPEPEALHILKTEPELGILEQNIYGGQIGIGFRDAGLRDRFNNWLADVRENGIYDEILNRWLKNPEKASMPVFPSPGNAKPIVIGTTAQNVPFSYLKDGKVVGFDIELVSRFAESEDRPLRFEIMNFGGLIPALSAGRIDVIANEVMITEERSKQVLFSEAYYTVGSSVLVQKKNLGNALPEGTKDGSDLGAASVGSMTGTIGEAFIESHYPTANLLIFDDIMDAIAALRAHKVDYVITAYTTALLASKKNADMATLPEEYVKDPAAIAIRKDLPELRDKINAVLQKLHEDGTVEKIIRRWVYDDGEGYAGVDNPHGPDAPVIRVAISANREPMCFIRDGKIVGLDSELIERIAVELGMRVEYMDMKFSALINALESKRAEVLISNFAVTEERSKRVLFTDTYFVNPQVLLTRKPVEQADETSPGFFSRTKESFYSNLIVEKRWKLIVDGLKATLIITLFATLLGTLIGGVICAMRMSRRRLVSGFAKLYISVMRGTPLLVMLMIFFYVVFASTGMTAIVVAVITFALNMAAYSSEMFRTSIEGVDPGQKEAGIAMGFTKLQTFIYIILPQAVRKVIPVYKGEVISLLKMTSIVGYIAVVDLTKASDIIRSRTFDAFFPLIVVAVIYFMLAWLISLGLDYLNKKVSSSK